MMRYQRVSPDCLPLSSGRKPKLTCKEDECGENERSQNYSSLEGKALRFRSGTTPSNIYLDQNLSQFVVSECEKHNTQRNERYESSSPSRGGDVVLQWGQNKRSRGSRSESRLVTEESVQSRQVMKIHKRVVEKQSTMNQMAIMPPPPTTTSPYSRRAANLRPCTPVREITGSFLNRNSEERSITGNGGSSSRFVSRSADKRSSLSPEKTDRMASCCSTVLGEKSNGSVAGANPMNHVESSPATLEQEAAVGGGGDKVNPNLFEWPRIYISLSRKEKEDDFFAMKGTKLPQRPKKRAKNIDKALQYCFPGMWLSDLTRGRYEVREKKNVKKQKRRGLKGMESMDSDSEL